MKWFPVDPRYKIQAKFTPHAELRKIDMLNILGDIESFESPGYVDFEIMGHVGADGADDRARGLALVRVPGRDQRQRGPTRQRGSCARDAPKNGEVTIDFNRTYNPPCAYNPYTTCPMPTKENRLEIRIEAGEKNYHDTHS